MLVLAAAAAAAVAAVLPPVGRWEGELQGGAPSGHLGNPGHNVPLLGNGYMGIVLQSSLQGSPGTHGRDFNGSTLDFFINTNANWDCERSATAGSLPPAVCSMRGLGGLTINTVNSTVAGQQLSSNSTIFSAEQRMANASLWTHRRSKNSRYALQTETVMHSEKNAMLTSVTFLSPDASAVVKLELALWTLGRTSHVRASSASECTLAKTPGLTSCSRRFNDPNTTDFFAPWTALGNRIVNASGGVRSRIINMCPNRFECISTATTVYEMQSGTTIQLVTTTADNLLHDNAHDPITVAASLALSVQPTSITAASKDFWFQYWNASSVVLPSRPALERMWYGAQYVTAAATASAIVVKRWRGRLPPPGLYGPFATGDFAYWNGDFTLDYNQEANFYHVFSSNHPEHAAAYWGPIVDYMPAARVQAQRQAMKARLKTCAAHALNYPCHLAPWGYQSRDTRTYMQWNGAYAALLFISSWEYTRDADFARNVTLPLLDGLNAWSHCYLRSNGTVLEDWNALSPDQVMENQPAHNPSIGLSLLRRIATAQRDIATALRIPYASYVDDIIARLAPLPVTQGPDKSTVWAAAENKTWEQSSVSNAVKDGVHFSSVLYPIWPSETVDALSAGDDATKNLARDSAFLYANLSCDPSYPEEPYKTCVDAGWGALTIFSALARVLPARETQRTAGDADQNAEVMMTAKQMADAFEGYIAAYGANGTNFLAYAPGGGVENIGLSQAVVDMLVQSSNGTIHLFPAWPADEPAAFQTLRVKGALLVSASWDPAQRAATHVAVTATVTSPHVSLANPFGQHAYAITVWCSHSGTLDVRRDEEGRFQWPMVHGEMCRVGA